MAERVNRNSIHLPQTSPLFEEWEGKWTGWELVMKPGTEEDERFERRQAGHPGLRLKETFLCEFIGGRVNGVYEWKITKKGEPAKIVYAGRTMCAKGDSLLQRVSDYCLNGSHKSANIDQVLDEGYGLKVRVLDERDVGETAYAMETKMLATYLYEWNEINN